MSLDMLDVSCDRLEAGRANVGASTRDHARGRVTRRSIGIRQADDASRRPSEAFAAFQRELPGGPTVADLVQFLMDDVAGDRLDADRLFPQLWAMSLVEPIMEELIDNLYDEYLVTLAETLRLVDVEHPEAEAIAIMSLVDGLTLFIGEGRRWARHRTGASRVVFDMVAERYGLPIPIGV